MEFRNLDIKDLIEVRPRKFVDPRGYFSETFRSDAFEKAVGTQLFVQDNQSLSRAAGTIRGLHFQTEPCTQGKLVRCLSGSIFDVAVDLRQNSPTYGQWEGIDLSAEQGNQLWIPAGFAHGFCTLEPDSVVSYKVTSYYSPSHDFGVRWDDSAIGIDWPAVADPETLSAKDRVQPKLADLPSYFSYKG